MKLHFPTLFLLPAMTLAFTQCTGLDDNGNIPSSSTQPAVRAPGFSAPLTAETGQGSVTIREGGRVLSTCRTAKPDVEATRWYSEQEQIVVKSRGTHGPATVELFQSSNGQLLGSVMAFEAANGPAWAQSMAE